MSDQLLRDFFVSSFQPLALRGRTEKTLKLYGTTLKRFERFLSRDPAISDLTDDTVGRFLSFARSTENLAPASVNKERNNILAIWRFACGQGVILKQPTVKPDREPVRVPKAWTKKELAKLFAAIKRQTGWIGGVPAMDWWHTLHMVAWETGERIGALMQVRWDDIDLTHRALLIPAENRKGGREDRSYKLTSHTIECLVKISHPQREMVFPWPYNPNYIWYRYSQLLKAAGLPSDSKSKFHRMRRSVASHAEAAGGNATELLGHSQRRVTRAYLDPRIVKQPNATDFLFRPDVGTGEV